MHQEHVTYIEQPDIDGNIDSDPVDNLGLMLRSRVRNDADKAGCLELFQEILNHPDCKITPAGLDYFNHCVQRGDVRALEIYLNVLEKTQTEQVSEKRRMFTRFVVLSCIGLLSLPIALPLPIRFINAASNQYAALYEWVWGE